MKKHIIMSIYVAILSWANTSIAANYYVCDTGSTCGIGWTTGNDSNACTSKGLPCKTISAGIGKISTGDTLVIGDGVYSGSANMINTESGCNIPSGSSTSVMTTIQAENDGGVTVDGLGSYATFVQYGNLSVDGHTPYGSAAREYTKIKGFIFANSSGGGVYVDGVRYYYFKNCGIVEPAAGNVVGLNVVYSDYCLVEGCYAWGGGRYKFATFHSFRTIFRNCVSRHDYSDTSSHLEPVASFAFYSSRNIEGQNLIDIDSDGTFVNPDGTWGAFFAPNTSATTLIGTIIFTNCITVNNKLGFGMSDKSGGDQKSAPVFRNCVGWKLRPSNDIIHSQGDIDLQKCTIGDVDGTPAYSWMNGWSGVENTVKFIDNIIYNWLNMDHALFYNVDGPDYLNIYGSGTAPYSANGDQPTHVTATNPLSNGLLYLPRIESGSALMTSGSSSGRIGANIVYQHGRTGTFWGQDGYNLLQDGTSGEAVVNLWPFSNEEIIKTKFATYNLHGVSGSRGFTTGTSRDGSAQTLTKYIWEYLGNQIPSDIYGGDTTSQSTLRGGIIGRIQ